MKNDFIETEQKRETDLQEFMAVVLKFHKRRDMLVYLLLLLIVISSAVSFYQISALKKELKSEHTKILKKIDHRYFNNVTTQEDIHKVKINTLNGHLFVTE